MSHDGTETATSEFDFGTEDRHELHGAIFGEPIGDVPRRPLQTVEVSATVISGMKFFNIGCK